MGVNPFFSILAPNVGLNAREIVLALMDMRKNINNCANDKSNWIRMATKTSKNKILN